MSEDIVNKADLKLKKVMLGLMSVAKGLVSGADNPKILVDILDKVGDVFRKMVTCGVFLLNILGVDQRTN